MRAILAAIKLLMATAFAVLRIKKIASGVGTAAEKVAKIKTELGKVMTEFTALAKATEPEWDDKLAEVLSGVVDLVADGLIEVLEKEGAE